MVMFTSDSIYWKPLKPRINCYSLDKVSTLYTYDPWTDASTSGRPIYCSVSLSQNTWGVFTFQIEAVGFSPSFSVGDRVVIECGKQSTQMTRLISGVIRQRGATRGADGKKLLTYSGSSTGIRLNERVTYIIRIPAPLTQDGITPDPNDPSMAANVLLQATIGLGTYPTTEVIDTSQISANSDVINFVGGLSVEYGEMQDVLSSIEEQSGGEGTVDANDVVQFRHDLSQYPPASGKGFTIKNKKIATDNADDTCYLRGRNWDYAESIYKNNNYSNHLYGILPSEPDPSGQSPATGLGGIRNDQFRMAQKFRPTHSHFLPGDIFISVAAHNGSSLDKNFSPSLDICTDTGGLPTNTSGKIVNMCGTQGSLRTSPSDTTADTIVSMDSFFSPGTANYMTSFDLDTTKDYWLIMKFTACGSSMAAGLDWIRWNYRSTGTGTVATTTSSTADSLVNGGTGWTTGSGLLWFALPRRRSQAFQCWDPKALDQLGGGTTRGGYITSSLANIPSYIRRKEAMYKYLSTQLYNMCRPQAIYNTQTVTAPNVPILPGDPIMISDSVLGFSASGSTPTMAVCGDMNYSWGSPGGQGMTYEAPTILSIQPVGPVSRYR